MRERGDMALLAAALATRVDSLVPSLLPNARRDGKHWKVGGLGGEAGQSLCITRTGAHAGTWSDFNPTHARASGDMLHLVAEVLHGGDLKQAADWARKYCGLGNLTDDEARRIRERDEAQARRMAAEEAQDKAKRAARALELWDKGKPFAGSPAEEYLRARAINITGLGRAPACLRFEPACFNSVLERRLPAMLAFVVDGARPRHMATHRTFLGQDEAGRWIKNPRLDKKGQKTTLGSYKGGHIPLWRGKHDCPMHAAPPGEWIAVAEGIEDALSIAVQKPELRCISYLAMGNLGHLLLPEQVGGLMIAADNDPTDDALNRQLEALNQRGIAYQLIRAPAPHKDMNDWLRASMAEQGLPYWPMGAAHG